MSHLYNVADIYQVLKEFIYVRGYKAEEEYLTNDEINKSIRATNMVVINCFNGKEKISIVLTPSDSVITGRRAEFIKMVKKLPKNNEIILISNKLVSTSIKEYIKSEGIALSSYMWNMFTINMTKAPLVPTHEILTSSEVTRLEEELFKDSKEFPNISVDDVQSIWLGAKVGDVIKITRNSTYSGKNIAYRRVVRDDNIM